MKAIAAHAHMIHAHEGQSPYAPLCLLHDVGRDVVDVALAQVCIAVEMLHVATVLEPSGRHEHWELFRLAFLKLLGGKVGIYCLTVVDGALPQHLVVPDYVIHFLECDVFVHQCA